MLKIYNFSSEPEEEETYTLPRGKLISSKMFLPEVAFESLVIFKNDGSFRPAYRCGSALLTVIITPFESQFFAKDSFMKHVKACKTFEVRRIWNGVRYAQLLLCCVLA